MVAVPAVGEMSPVRMLKVVVLPAPGRGMGGEGRRGEGRGGEGRGGEERRNDTITLYH